MRKVNRWTWILALLALLLVVACQGESPTAPSTGPGSGTPPPSGATIILSVSNPKPLVSSTTVITATVTQGGTAVPNGTAVEFETDFGVFSDTGTAKTIRTTTGGMASATLSSTAPGLAIVTVRVNNVTKTTQVTFQELPVTPPPVDTALAITSIDPTSGSPAGGLIVRIVGRNIREPVRVLFGTLEARVVSVSSTEIKVVTPAIILGPTAQALDVDVTVIGEAGTSNEQKVVSPQKFHYELEILIPNIFTVSPASGPNEGNTRVTIFGEGFQPPAKVFFTDIEADVISITYNQIIVMTPPALGLGVGMRDTSVAVRVLNLGSNKEFTKSAAFRYGPLMQITSISPTEGPFTGGTKVTINGWGFDDPVAVSIGDVAAQVIRVSGTEIVAMTVPIEVSGCGGVSGPVTVTNVEDGATFTSAASFTYRVPTPVILSVTPSAALRGSVISVEVANAFGVPRITIGGIVATIQSATISGSVTTFSVIVPAAFVLGPGACTGSFAPTLTDVKYESVTSACASLPLANGLTVLPPNTGTAFYTPTAFAPFAATYTAATAAPTPAIMTPSAAQTVTLVNTGAGPLQIMSVTQSAGCANFVVTAPPTPQTLNACDSAAITAFYNPPVAGGAIQNSACTITVVTDAGTKTFSLVGSSH